MVVLEGPDCSGKSTFGEFLSIIFRKKLVHAGSHPEGKEDARDRMVRDLKRMSDRSLMDRSFLISESVYSQVFDRPDIRKEHSWKRMIEISPIVVYCRPPLDVILDTDHVLKDHDDEEKLKVIIENTERIVGIYDEVMDQLSKEITVIMYDYTQVSTTQEIVKTLTERNLFDA